jgi:aspartyl-tRNA(Asn)/glutamyl-tRNA(Gln) amidotransferase subunit B
LHRPGEPWGTRVEVKNVNKIKAVMRAIEFEIARQSAMLDAGQRVPLETRYFDASNGSTVFMRSKETETDYRYMPEPDLPPLRLAPLLLHAAQESLPELPDSMRLLQRQLYSGD